MKAVFLDAETLGKGFPLKALEALPLSWTFYPATSPDEVSSRLEGVSIAVTNKVRLGKELLEKAPQLKLICAAATGYDHIDLATARAQGISVCNIPAYSASSVAQLTLLFILALSHSLVSYAQATRAGRWEKSAQFCFLDYPVSEVEGKRLGIIGYGSLGKKVGQLAQGFGIKIAIAQHQDPARSPAGALPLPELLASSDFITLHLPSNPKTKRFFGAKEFALMKRTAFFINTARGDLVDEGALYEALQQRRIAGAAIDVMAQEPPPPGHPLLQKEIPNLIVTPHIGWASIESRQRLVETLVHNIASFLEGRLQNQVS